MNKKSAINHEIMEHFENNYKIMQSLLSPALGFHLNDKNKNKNAVPSKLGGMPDIEKIEWPKHDDTFLSFLCQVNLSDLNSIDNELPKTGILYFFLKTDLDNRFPEKKNDFKVIYRTEGTKNATNDCGEAYIFDESFFNFFEHYTIPSFEEYSVAKLLDDDYMNDSAFCEDIIAEITGQSEDCRHHVLGDPEAIQGAVKFWWAVDYLGLPIREYNSFEIKSIGLNSKNFIHLLQLDFIDEMIGFDGFSTSRAYFGIHKEDLLNQNFDKVKLIIQST